MPNLLEALFTQLPLKDIIAITPQQGGDVNRAYRVETKKDTFFLLLQPDRKADFYANEIEGLQAFKRYGITAPHVIANGVVVDDLSNNSYKSHAYLLLTYLEEERQIDGKRNGQDSQKELAYLVGKLHRVHSKDGRFGFSTSYQGSALSFANQWVDSWSELFLKERMDGLSFILKEKGFFNREDYQTYLATRALIAHVLTNYESEPSLLHGDLWGGNYMFLKDGRPALFDPAPFYGDREFDLGITTVFGGFSAEFYEAYHHLYPLAPRWQKRLEFYRLYLLLVHLNKFGVRYYVPVINSMTKIRKSFS